MKDNLKNNLKNFVTWKIQLTSAINFLSSKDTNEESLMHSVSDNIETMINDKVDQVIEELLNYFFLDIKSF